MKFENQRVIVTGGTRGIGAAISEAFLKEGAFVTATFSHGIEAAAKFKEEQREFGNHLSLEQFDVSVAASVETFYSKLDSQDQKISVLVNNAGIRRDAIVGMLTEEDWDAVLDINLKGCYLMSKGAVQRMSRLRRGKIVNITSPSSRMGFAGQGNYAASKAGMIAFTKTLSQEVAKRNICVNCVSPGFTSTDLISDLKEDMLLQYKSSIPMGRFGTPKEVADAVLFLSSDQASYITGAVLDVTGGI